MTISALEQTFTTRLQQLAPDLPMPFSEYVFAPPRKWRFDFAWPDRKVAVELEGGVWSGGRHVRPSGFEADVEKYNRANELGWRILRFTTKALDSDPDACIRTLRNALIPSAISIIDPDALPALRTNKWRVDAFGLVVTERLSYDEWRDCGAAIWQHRQASSWAAGDWVAYGETWFSEDSAQAMTLSEYSEQTIANYASVSRAFPMARRIFKLSHSHYDAARGFRDLEGKPDHEAQNAVLALCEKNGLGRDVVREAARKYRAELQPTPDADDADPLPHGGNDDDVVTVVEPAPPTYDELLAFVRQIALIDVYEIDATDARAVLYDLVDEARQHIGVVPIAA